MEMGSSPIRKGKRRNDTEGENHLKIRRTDSVPSLEHIAESMDKEVENDGGLPAYGSVDATNTEEVVGSAPQSSPPSVTSKKRGRRTEIEQTATIDEMNERFRRTFEATQRNLERIATYLGGKMVVPKLAEEIAKVPGLTSTQIIEAAEAIGKHNHKMHIFLALPANIRKDYVSQVLADAGMVPSFDGGA